MKTRPGFGLDTERDVAISDTVAASGDDVGARAPIVGGASTDEPVRGDSIGRFVVLGVLGSGGMGVVYSAYDPQLDRKVAIKLLGAVAVARSDDATMRLLREAQAMAKINHPNVIKVHEVGTYREQVFVAMEFADAGTVRGWLKNATRSRREILDVFAAAGRGLGAAHAVGLVHRDFKPDNVLMSSDGSIRVTDFGLVSVADAPPPRAVTEPPIAADGALTNDTPLSQDLTRTGSIMGTPTYMAPEQFSGRGSTPRTDQFAFCVALYEALYGERPFAGDNYQQLSASVLMGEIEAAPKGAQVPPWIRRVLLRGLATDPEKRYPSMGALLDELAHDPAKRRRTLLIAGAGVVLVGGAVAFVATRAGEGGECRGGGDRLAAVWNPRERARIEAALVATKRPHAAATVARFTKLVDAWGASWQGAYLDACEDTRVRGEQSERLLDLRMACLGRRLDDAKSTLELLAAGGPDVADRALSAAQALPSPNACSDAEALLAAVAPPPSDAARIQVAGVRAMLDAAWAQRRLGRYAAGLEAAKPALAAARASNYAPVIAEALLATGTLQHDVADKGAIETLREAMRTAAGAGHHATMIDASAWLVFALTQETDRYELATEIGSLADALVQHTSPGAEISVRLANVNALLEAKQGKLDAAQVRYERALALAQKELGPDSPGTMTTLNQLGNLAKQQGRFDVARKYLEDVVASRERVIGKDHPDVASALNNVGNVYRVEGDLAKAKEVYDRALAIRIAALGPDHPEVGTSYNNLGVFYGEAGDNDQAEAYARKTIALWEKHYGKDHVEVTGAVMNLANALQSKGNFAEARATFERARKILERAKGPEHPDVAGVLSNLGTIALDENKLDEAFKLLTRAEQIGRAALGPEHPDVVGYMANLTNVYKRQGKLQEAQELTQRTLTLMAKAFGPDHPQLGGALVNFGTLQIELGKHAAALESFKRALAIFEAKLGGEHPYVAYALNGIGGTLIELDRHAEGVPHLERAVAIRVGTKQSPGDIAEARYNLAQALIASPKTRKRAIDEAKTALREYEQAGDAEQVKHVAAWIKSPS